MATSGKNTTIKQKLIIGKMLDLSPSYLHFCAPAETALLPEELTPVHQPQPAFARLRHLCRPVHNLHHYSLVLTEVSVKNTSQKFMATVELNK